MDSGLQHLLLFHHRCGSVVEAGKTKRYLDPPDCPHHVIVLNQKLISHGIRTVWGGIGTEQSLKIFSFVKSVAAVNLLGQSLSASAE